MSIIESAYEILEKNPRPNYRSDLPSWQYLSFKYKKNTYRIVFEYNQFYGELVRQFMINDNILTDVKCKYTGELLMFDVSNGLCGERAFENNSISYEYLLKPLGIKYKKYATYYDFLQWLEEKKIKYFEARY